jgi:hypothetical protein
MVSDQRNSTVSNPRDDSPLGYDDLIVGSSAVVKSQTKFLRGSREGSMRTKLKEVC